MTSRMLSAPVGACRAGLCRRPFRRRAACRARAQRGRPGRCSWGSPPACFSNISRWTSGSFCSEYAGAISMPPMQSSNLNVNGDQTDTCTTRRGFNFYSANKVFSSGTVSKLFSYSNTLYAASSLGQFAQDNGAGTGRSTVRLHYEPAVRWIPSSNVCRRKFLFHNIKRDLQTLRRQLDRALSGGRSPKPSTPS